MGGRRVLRLAAAVVAAASAWSCGDDGEGELPRTIRVAVSTDLAVPDEVDGLTISVARGGSEVFARSYDRAAVEALPDSLLLDNARRNDDTGDPILTPILVRVAATLGGEEVVVRSAEIVFQNDEAKVLRLPLCSACVGVPCEAGETCRRGDCVDEGVDVDSLPADGEGVELAAECAAE